MRGAVTRARLALLEHVAGRVPAWYLHDARRSLRVLERTSGRSRGRDADPWSLTAAERRRFSQNGEDGVIEELVRRVGAPGRCFVEIGASDGEENCTRNLAEQGWRGVWLEADPDRCRIARARGLEGVQVVEGFARRAGVVGVLDAHGVPAEPDVLVVDIDGDDRGVLAAVLGTRRPRIVVVEYNADFRPPAAWSLPERRATGWDGTFRFGASLQALCDAAPGYVPVYCDTTGVNAFLVRADLAAAAGGGGSPARLHRPAAHSRHPFGHIRSRAALRAPVGLDLDRAERVRLERAVLDGRGPWRPGVPVGCELDVVNDSGVELSSGRPGGFQLVLRWYDGEPPVDDAPRTPLPYPVRPGTRRRVVLWMPAPERPGRHVLRITAVVEGVAWLEHLGGAGTFVDLEVDVTEGGPMPTYGSSGPPGP
ncbi:MAG: hypothetical protein ACOYOP_04095 [Microthrixaceae bacterium]